MISPLPTAATGRMPNCSSNVNAGPTPTNSTGSAPNAALKTMMETLGIPVAGEYRCHVDGLWPKYRSLIEARGETRYLVDGAPFSDWSANERYAPRDRVDGEKARRHRKGVEEVRLALENAMADGRS